MKEKFETKIV